MQKKIIDWKDIADSYYEKALSLSILILLFAFLVSPKLEVKPFKRVVRIVEAIDIPPEIKEKIKPPEETVKPVVEIIVEDDLGEDEDEDIEIVSTIEKTTLDPYEEKVEPPKFGQTSKFVVYEDAPVAIKQVRPVYPDFARNSGIEGEVWLEVEVFADGTVGAIDVVQSLLSGPGGLDEAAINAVKQWEFQPAKSGGKPVSVWVTFPIDFGLD
jgi:periplasmic protein TonB